jgi:hypothetical protein
MATPQSTPTHLHWTTQTPFKTAPLVMTCGGNITFFSVQAATVLYQKLNAFALYCSGDL